MTDDDVELCQNDLALAAVTTSTCNFQRFGVGGEDFQTFAKFFVDVSWCSSTEHERSNQFVKESSLLRGTSRSGRVGRNGTELVMSHESRSFNRPRTTTFLS